MLTFFSHCRPFTGEFDALQRMAIESWRAAVPGCEVILLSGGYTTPTVVATEMDLAYSDRIGCNSHGTELVSSIFKEGERLASHDLLCEISADIVLGGDFALALEAIADIERPFVVGQRWDIDPGAAAETAKLHPPSAVDYFIFRRGTLGEIPPFAVGRTCYDNWLVWAAVHRWDLMVIDATEAITAIHVNHSHPEYGSKEKMLASQERQENVRLAHESGCTYWPGTDYTPWVIRHGRVETR